MYCVVRDCKSIWKPNSNLKFHSFPHNIERRNSWLARLPLKGKFYSSAKICNLHFKPDDYDPGRPGRLRNSASPFYISQSCNYCHLNSTKGMVFSNFALNESRGAVAPVSSVTQRVLPVVISDTRSLYNHEADKANTSQQQDTTYEYPLHVTLDIKDEVFDPDDNQPMEQDQEPVENGLFIKAEIKKEPVEDTCEFENSVTVLSHIAKSTDETEELKEQVQAKTIIVEKYKSEIDNLQKKNFVLQDRCERLTKLVKKCITKSPCKEIGIELKEILSHPPDKVENGRKKDQQKESQFKAKIKMLLESIEESQGALKAKQKQWETKETEYLEKIKKLEKKLQGKAS